MPSRCRSIASRGPSCGHGDPRSPGSCGQPFDVRRQHVRQRVRVPAQERVEARSATSFLVGSRHAPPILRWSGRLSDAPAHSREVDVRGSTPAYLGAPMEVLSSFFDRCPGWRVARGRASANSDVGGRCRRADQLRRDRHDRGSAEEQFRLHGVTDDSDQWPRSVPDRRGARPGVPPVGISSGVRACAEHRTAHRRQSAMVSQRRHQHAGGRRGGTDRCRLLRARPRPRSSARSRLSPWAPSSAGSTRSSSPSPW